MPLEYVYFDCVYDAKRENIFAANAFTGCVYKCRILHRGSIELHIV